MSSHRGVSARPPRPRLIAIDIDGTLVDSSQHVPAANREALERAHRAGLEIVLVTGRRHAFALPIAQALGFEVCLISSNGAMTKTLSGELFHSDFLPAATVRRLCGHMADFRRYMVITFDGEGKSRLALESMEALRGSAPAWLEANRESLVFVRPVEDSLTEDPIQAMLCGDLAAMARAEERLLAWPEKDEITLLKTRYPQRDLALLDILNRGCSKGHAVERWSRARGITAPEVVAIGDNYNDVEMLNFAGQAFIMGNACEELKRNGWRLTCSNDECGVAAAIKQVID